MSLTIEIYPSKQKKNLFSEIKFKIENSLNYSTYAKGLKFIKGGDEVYDFIIDNSDSISSNQVISSYCKSLFINAYEIDDAFTASDIVENLFKLDEGTISSKFIQDFSSVGMYYSLVSKATRSENEVNLMLLLACTLAEITNGLIFFAEGGNYFNTKPHTLYTSDEFFLFANKIIEKDKM